MASTAQQGDFLGGGGTIAPRKIYAPGEEPNPRNPGGISDNALKRQREAERIRQLATQQADDLKRAKQARAAKIARDQREASDAMHKRTGGVWGDVKVLGPVALKAAGTAAAIVATGGAAAGAVGITAAAGVTAAATTASKAIDAVNTGTKVAGAIKRGDAKALAGEAIKGGSNVASVAGLGLSANDKKKLSGVVPKVKVPAAVKTAASTAKKAKAVVKAATQPAAGKTAVSSAVKKATAKSPLAGSLNLATKSIASVSTKPKTQPKAQPKSAQAMVPLYPGAPFKVPARPLTAVQKAIASAPVQLKSGNVKTLQNAIKAVGSVAAGGAAGSAVSKAINTAAKKPAGSPTTARTSSGGGGSRAAVGPTEEGYFIATTGPNKGKIDFTARRWARAS